MTTRSHSRNRGLHMSLLALTASASIVVGMFATAVPAYSDDTPEVPAASCLVESEGEASVFVSSVVHAGESLSLEGRGWTAGTDQSRGFVVVTLDDGAVERGADMELPEWVPTGVARNRSAWAVLEVNSEGAFSGDIPVPSAWAAGESHQVAIGDGVSGTYVSVQVSVVDSAVGVQACSLSVNEPDPADPVAPPEPAPDVPGEPALLLPPRRLTRQHSRMVLPCPLSPRTIRRAMPRPRPLRPAPRPPLRHPPPRRAVRDPRAMASAPIIPTIPPPRRPPLPLRRSCPPPRFDRRLIRISRPPSRPPAKRRGV